MDPDGCNPEEWVFAVFSQITSTHLEHAQLDFRIVSDLDAVDWARIEHMFTQQRWANFQKLTIRLSGRFDDISEAIEFVRLRLPVLNGRDALKVYVDYIR